MSTKSAHKIIKENNNSNSINHDGFNWNVIWKSHLPLEFFYLIATIWSIFIRWLIKSKLENISKFCPLFNEGVETIEYVLFKCDHACASMFGSPKYLGIAQWLAILLSPICQCFESWSVSSEHLLINFSPVFTFSSLPNCAVV